MKSINSTTEQNSEKILNQTLRWSRIKWDKVERSVNRLQTRIAKAVIEKKFNKAKRLCYLLTHSLNAKLLAVRKVTTNKGKHTPGVDGEIWLTEEQKMQAALRLTDKHYNAKPLRRVYIEKKGKSSLRPLGIPCMYDRAMQALYALALSPIAETTADSHSFGFRMGRSAQDAQKHIFITQSRKCSAKWILEGDIKGCFDNINHDWLMAHIPMDKSILAQFLKAGYIYQDTLFPTDAGTPQGGIISPILANMTLDGIQDLLKRNFRKKKVNLTRYADDFIVTAESRQVAEEAKELIREFLRERGLELSDEKTVITNIDDGYDFLGWNVRKYNDVLIIRPSKKSIKSIVDKLSTTIKDWGMRATQEGLIKKLNPMLQGWANYHRVTCAKRTFSKISNEVFNRLLSWAKHRHGNKSSHWIVSKYWHTRGKRNWVFCTENVELFNISAVKIIRHRFLKFSMNPYLDREYFERRFQKSNA